MCGYYRYWYSCACIELVHDRFCPPANWIQKKCKVEDVLATVNLNHQCDRCANAAMAVWDGVFIKGAIDIPRKKRREA